MPEGARGDINLHTESKLDKMARGITEETGAQGDIQGSTPGTSAGIHGGAQGDAQEGDALVLIEGKMNEMAADITEDTGGHGDIHLHTQRKMDEMARKMFEED